MHEYTSISAVLATTLREYLSASKLALEFRKPSDWGPEAGHCLGFATALLLFCAVDAIGSYHRGSPATFLVEGKPKAIDSADFRHFFVLNSPEYYGQALSHSQIKDLYDDYRSLLAHNATVAVGRAIIFDPDDDQIFPVRDNQMMVNLPAFHNRSISAVENFLRKDLAQTSQVARNMAQKS